MPRRGAGEGSIFKRESDGRYVARLVVEEAGRPRRRIDEGAPVVDANVSVARFLERWRETTLAAAEIADTKRENYATLSRRHLEVGSIAQRALGRLTPADVEALVLAKREAGLADSTVRSIYTVLRRALDAAVRDGLVRRNVAAVVGRPRVARQDARVLTPEDAQVLLDAARGSRLFAFYAVAMGCGLRRGEGLALRWSDVNFETGTLRITRSLKRTKAKGLHFGPTKNGNGRTVGLPGELLNTLRVHRAAQTEERLKVGSAWHDGDLVFPSELGTPLDPRNALRGFQVLAHRAGLPGVKLHTLRHTSASLLLAQGVHPRVVMEILGHSGISITMDLDTHVMPQQTQDAATRIGTALVW